MTCIYRSIIISNIDFALKNENINMLYRKMRHYCRNFAVQ